MQDIVIKIPDTEAAKMASSLKASGVDVKAVGDRLRGTGDVGHLGGIVISESCQEAAQELGLPGPVARRLGNTAESLVVSFGALATGIGAVVVVAAVAYAAYSKYMDAKREHRETLELSVEQLKGEVLALEDQAGVSDKVQKATYDLAMAKRALLQVEIPKLIESLNKQLKEENEKLEKGGSVPERILRHLKALVAAGALADDYLNKFLQAEAAGYKTFKDKQLATIAVIQGIINLRKAEQSVISATPPTREEQQYPKLARMQDSIDQEKAMLDFQTATGVLSMSEQMQKEVDILAMQHDQELTMLRLQAAHYDHIFAVQVRQQIEKATLLAQLQTRAVTFYFETSRNIMQGIMGLLEMTVSGNEQAMKALYYIKRSQDAIQASYDYAIAGTNQYTKGGKYGLYLAIFYWFMMVAVPIAIMAVDIDGMNAKDPADDFAGLPAADFIPSIVKRKRTINIVINNRKTDTFEQTEGWVRKQFPVNDETEDRFTVTHSLTA